MPWPRLVAVNRDYDDDQWPVDRAIPVVVLERTA